MWVAAGTVLAVLMFLCAYGAISILSTIALITKGRTTMPRQTIANLNAIIDSMRKEISDLSNNKLRLEDLVAKQQSIIESLSSANVDALIAEKDAEIARLKDAAGKAGRRANHAESAKREPTPITEATLTLVGDKVEAQWKQGAATHKSSTHQKYIEGLVARLLAGGCAASAIKRVGFSNAE